VKRYHPEASARAAASTAPDRPAISILHDEEEGKMVVFRLAPGQAVAEHTSASSVFLTVVSGEGFVTGAEGERSVGAGEVFAIAPREPHGMRAGACEMLLAAFITPRPGSR
jgi:quercetin dioxygenase-like cupin family protein